MTKQCFDNNANQILKDTYETLLKYVTPDESLKLAKQVVDSWASAYQRDSLTGDYTKK